MYKTKTYAVPCQKENLNEAITYDFYNEQDAYGMGFHGFTACHPIMQNHKMDVVVEWHSNSFLSEDHLSLNATIYHQIKLRLKNTSMLTKSRVAWITEEDDEWDDVKSYEFDLRPQDQVYYEYAVNLSSHPAWKGTIRQVKFFPLVYDPYDPANSFQRGFFGKILSYDYIQFASEPQYELQPSFLFKYDTEGFTPFADTCMAIKRGMLFVDWKKSGGIVSPAKLRIRAKYLFIRLKNNSAAKQMTLRVQTSEGNSLVSLDIDAFSATFKEYAFALPPEEINAVSLLWEESGTAEIDYILFGNEEREKDISLCAKKLTLGVSDACEWQVMVKTCVMKYVRLLISNATWANSAQLQWLTVTDRVYDDRKSQWFHIEEMSEGKEYTIGLNQNAWWNGEVTDLRLSVPDMPSGSLEVSGAITVDGDTMCENREVIEGWLDRSTENWSTGWTFDRSGGDVCGYVDSQNNWVLAMSLIPDDIKRGTYKLHVDPIKGKPVSMQKTIVRTCNQLLRWCFHFQLDSAAGNVRWELKDDGNTVLGFEVKDGALLSTNGQMIIALSPLTWYQVQADVDLSLGTAKVYIDGISRCVVDLNGRAVDSIHICACADREVTVCGTNQLYKIGYAFEDFYGIADGKTPESLCFQKCEGVVNDKALCLSSDHSGWIAKFPFKRSAYGCFEIETELYLENVETLTQLELHAGNKKVCLFCIKDGSMYNQQGICVKDKVLKCNWYYVAIRMNPQTGRGEVRLNGQICTTCNIPAGEWADAVSFSGNQGAEMRIGLLRAAPYTRSRVPYIDKVSSKTGLVGMQAWFIFDGMWMRVNNQYSVSDKDPYLGYYDDRLSEAVDWQIKWMAEHGVDFIAPFFYHNLSKPPHCEGTDFLNTFFFKSEHNSSLKACVCLGELNGNPTQEAMLDEMRHLIETYFHHDSYLKVDNKPVLLTYSWSELSRQLGSKETCSLYHRMREMCCDAGFDGLLLLGEHRTFLDGKMSGPNIPLQCGLDGVFAYCNIYTPKAALTYSQTAAMSGLDAVPSVGCGWDNRYWAPPEGYFIQNSTPAQFEACLRTIRDEWWEEQSDKLSKKMILLDNWSEFGEGHSIQPSNLFGFGYLNAVRKVFSDAEERHFDTVPEGAFNALNLNPTELDEPFDFEVIHCRIPMPE